MARSIQTHSTERDGKRYIWYTERLWELAKDLPEYDADVELFEELDRDCWFGEGRTPTIREVADHCRRINETDPRIPVIINDNGRLMDGGHRLARALLEGRKTVKAVRFEKMPEPDEIEEIQVDSNLGLWSARWISHSWFRNELKRESDLLHHGFYLLYQCISLYNRILSNPKNLSDPYIEVCALTTVKAHRFIFGIYNLTIDGIAQESGALLRPLIETCDLLKYVRVNPERAADIKNNKKPSAGEIGKRIDSDFQGLRNHLNKNASHLSFSEDSIRHLRDSESGSLKFIPTHGRIVLQKNLSTVNAFLNFLLFESVSCLGYIGMEINELADEIEQWRDESYIVNLKA